MPTPDSILSPLSAVRTKVRRLTRSPSTSQLTNDQIDDYINTFVLYDFPEFTVDKQLVFFTMPNVDVYSTNEVNEDDPLYNFKNVYLSAQDPVYIAGLQSSFSQSRTQFFGQYPKTLFEESIGTGNDVTTAFAGTLSFTPVLANSISFSSIDTNGNGIVVKDDPRTDVGSGIQTMIGDLIVPDAVASVGTINYLTGVYAFTFPVAPGAGESVVSQAYSYKANRPRAILFEDNSFTFRPVPDKSYRIEIDVFQRPTEMLNDTDEPDIAQWWQYIAYGAAKKVFEDRMDVESVQAIMQEFTKQRALVLQRLVIQQASERTATIYTGKGVGFYGDKDFF
jgi:hypothetical protein